MKGTQAFYLQQRSNSSTGVPEHRSKVWHWFTFLAKFQQGVLSGFWTWQFIDPLVDLLPVHLGQGRDISHSLWERERGREERASKCTHTWNEVAWQLLEFIHLNKSCCVARSSTNTIVLEPISWDIKNHCVFSKLIQVGGTTVLLI